MSELQSKKWEISKNSIDFKIEWLEDVESDSSDSQSDSFKKQLKLEFECEFQHNIDIEINYNQKNERFQKIQLILRLSDWCWCSDSEWLEWLVEWLIWKTIEIEFFW